VISDDKDLKIISQHFRYVVDYSSIAVITDFGPKLTYLIYCSFQIKKL
jgi:hypothetical protein